MKQLIEFLSKTLNLDADRLADILYKKADDGTPSEELNEDVLPKLLDLDKGRIAKIKEEGKGSFDNGYKKAQKEISEQWENRIKTTFELETDAVGEELLTAIKEKAGTGGKTSSEEDVKKHPLYLSLEKKYLLDLKAAKEEGERALEEFKSKMTVSELKNMAKGIAKEKLLSKKPVLEDDQNIAETRIQDFLRELESYDYQKLDDGTLLPIKDGKRLENDHSHPISFDALIDSVASRRFKFEVQDPKGNGGNKNDPGGKKDPVKFTGKVPANEDELLKAYSAITDPEERAELIKAYEDAHGEITF